jgi:hypothetical protein
MHTMFRFSKAFKTLAIAMAFAGTAMVSTAALADKIVTKDGTVYQGKIVREGPNFYYIKVKIGTLEQDILVHKDDVKTLERDTTAAPRTDENIQKEEDAKKADAKKDESKHTGATKVAILNFGPPSEWQGQFENMVGVQISAEAFKQAVPLLEKAGTEIVVIRVNSGGGYGLESDRFRDLFEKEYKPKFRTVAWIESAISAAAMSPWVLEEMYFFRKGNIGACTGWSGNLVAVKGMELEEMLYKMEKASALGKKDPAIMRSMQILNAPLSVDIDENGEVHWRQDEQGKFVLNTKDHIFTMTASEAMKFKFGKGIADTKEELVKAMNLQEVEWVAPDAVALIDKSIRDNDNVDKHNKVVLRKYQTAIGAASNQQDKERRGIELAKAKKLLAELRQMIKVNPNFKFHLGIPEEWFQEQDDLIKRLAALP